MIERTRRPHKRAEYEAELALPALPAALEYLWIAYRRLRRRKGGNGFGPSPIEWPDINAFCRYNHLDLVPWEIEVIEEIDDLFLDALNKKTSDHGN